MKIVFVSIYPKETIARYLLSSYVLKSYLDKYYSEGKLETKVLNFKEDEAADKVYKKIAAEGADIIGYSCYIWNIEKILKIAELVKKNMSVVQVLGGPEISESRISALNESDAPDYADYFIIGEGERVLLNLVNYINSGEKKNEKYPPAGAACVRNKKIIYTANKEKILNLDEIPSIYISGTIEDRLFARQQAFIETQRGCLFKCRYCLYHKNLSGISYFSLERVFDELRFLIVEKKISALRIFDAVFNSSPKRAKQIVEYIISLKNETRLPFIYWEMECRNLDEEFIKLIAGLKYGDNIKNNEEIAPKDAAQQYNDMIKDYTAVNCFGIQSFNPMSLKAVNRSSVDMGKLETFMSLVKKYNIVLKIDMILGLPLETMETYFRGLEVLLPFIKGSDHILNIHRLQILPGSELEDLCGDYKIEYLADSPHTVLSNSSFSREDMRYTSRFTAVLLRVVNSPLRKYLFKTAEKMNTNGLAVTKGIYTKLKELPEFRDIGLNNKEIIDDDYWNDDVYKEVGTNWLIDYFNGLTARAQFKY